MSCLGGRSACRVLTQRETARYGGSARKQLFGCALCVFDDPASGGSGGLRSGSTCSVPRSVMLGGGGSGVCGNVALPEVAVEREVMVFTWSQVTSASQLLSIPPHRPSLGAPSLFRFNTHPNPSHARSHFQAHTLTHLNPSLFAWTGRSRQPPRRHS